MTDGVRQADPVGTGDVVRCVREGSASLGVCWDSTDLRGLVARPYREDQLVLAVHPDHPLAGRSRIPFSASLDHEHVGLPPATAVYQMLHLSAARSGRVMSYRIIVSTFEAAMRVVCANLGVSVIPLEVAERYARTGEVVTVRLTDAWARRRFVVLSRESPAPGQAAERLAQHLVEVAAAARVVV